MPTRNARRFVGQRTEDEVHNILGQHGSLSDDAAASRKEAVKDGGNAFEDGGEYVDDGLG